MSQLARRNEELLKALELAESAKAALEKEMEMLIARDVELEQSLTIVTGERDVLAEEARQA